MQTDKLVLTPSQQSMLNATIRDPVDPPYLLQLVLILTNTYQDTQDNLTNFHTALYFICAV